jgi:uncharacterized protein YjeT (DUF2065 family)
MATSQQPAPPASASTDVVTVVLVIVGATQVLVGLLAFFAPSAFYDLIASYSPENDHFLKDLGSWQIGLGALTLYGARRPDWRLPLLGFLALQYSLHTVAHVVDAGDAEEDWQDAFAIVTQGFGALLLVGLFLRERSR